MNLSQTKRGGGRRERGSGGNIGICVLSVFLWLFVRPQKILYRPLHRILEKLAPKCCWCGEGEGQ